MIYIITGNKHLRLDLVSTLLFVFSCSVHVTTPNNIYFHGYLTYSCGSLINSAISIVFSFYNIDTGGIIFWSDTKSVEVNKGLFTAKLK